MYQYAIAAISATSARTPITIPAIAPLVRVEWVLADEAVAVAGVKVAVLVLLFEDDARDMDVVEVLLDDVVLVDVPVAKVMLEKAVAVSDTIVYPEDKVDAMVDTPSALYSFATAAAVVRFALGLSNLVAHTLI